MGVKTEANDWQACGIAQAGFVAGVGAGCYVFQFRSKNADCIGDFLFIAGGGGLGGSLGGGSGPSPADVIRNRSSNLWTALTCKRPFSAENLNLSYAEMLVVGASVAYGYSYMEITAGLLTPLFKEQDVSGWGTGVGAVGAVLFGAWKMIGNSRYSV